MQDFEHFLITRHNLRVEQWSRDKRRRPVLTPNWQSFRLELLLEYCFPSVMNQSAQRFTWLIYIDDQTPEDIESALARELSRYENVELVAIDGEAAFKGELHRNIQRRLDSTSKILITTRLDSDDILHKDALESVQAHCRTDAPALVDLRKGFMLEIGTEGRLAEVSRPYNPFLSLIESVEHFETVWKRPHFRWAKSDVRCIAIDERLWIQGVHGTNMVNTMNDLRMRYRVGKFKNTSKYVSALPQWKDFSLETEPQIRFGWKERLANLF